MDLSPIQRVTAAANAALRPPLVDRPESPPPVAQAAPVSADQQVESSTAADHTRVTVEWHAASVGYVTRVIDQHTGHVVHQSPPEQVLNMVQRIIERLKVMAG